MYRNGMYRCGTLLTCTEVMCTEVVMYQSGPNPADRISGSIKSKMAADGHLGMTALSRVTLTPAGLSCSHNVS